MVDIMATTSEDFKKPDDFEDGELPEEGEICDDEEPARENIIDRSSPSQSNSATSHVSVGSGPSMKMPLPHHRHPKDIEGNSVLFLPSISIFNRFLPTFFLYLSRLFTVFLSRLYSLCLYNLIYLFKISPNSHFCIMAL
uniref:CTNNB1_binding domain-containing protein n=1 Tax=Heterorhabditis bacteriophora TaxID=37862 RepID=A0A1I7WMM3_HETBA